MPSPPVLVWLRRDLRLSDHPALQAAAAQGPVLPVYILDPIVEAQYGGAAKWRLAQSLAALDRDIKARGGRLILRRGDALATLQGLIAETGAQTVIWSRLYDSVSIARDAAVKQALTADGVAARSVNGSLLHEPWTLATKAGTPFKVYTPFSKACFAAEAIQESIPAPSDFAPPVPSDDLASWGLERPVNRGGAVLAMRTKAGEQAARDRLDAFIDHALAHYKTDRDRFDKDATSGTSPFLAFGEIAPWTAWRAARAAFVREPTAEQGGLHFLKELLWREFAYHLLYHFPEIETRNWRSEWDAFPWRADNSDAERWRRGMTGVPMVDAAMREMYVTGVMHNRGRMLTASYLTKHLLTDWRVGEAWFRACLIDWDPASNAMGWQWTAGSGPDAAPYFRIYNPDTQQKKLDPEDAYVRRWVAELSGLAQSAEAQAYFDAAPRSWGLNRAAPYPAPVADLAAGRAKALAAYETLRR